MKKKIFCMCRTGILLATLVAGFTACSKEPLKPEDETLNKEHDTPKKAVLTLTEGIVDATGSFVASKDANAVQIVTFVDDKSWHTSADGKKQFDVKNGANGIHYRLTLRYFNKSGKDITHEFIENGQDLIHQHFFLVPDADARKYFEYTYVDTTPWNKEVSEGAKLTGNSNPIGMKGVFRFVAENTRCEMRIRLMHARISKFKNGQASPYYEPTKGQILNDHWDLIIQLPVVIS